MIYLSRWSHISIEASPTCPFFTRRVVRPMGMWFLDNQPSQVELVNGRVVSIVSLQWSEENYPVQVLVDSSGLRHRWDVVKSIL